MECGLAGSGQTVVRLYTCYKYKKYFHKCTARGANGFSLHWFKIKVIPQSHSKIKLTANRSFVGLKHPQMVNSEFCFSRCVLAHHANHVKRQGLRHAGSGRLTLHV